MKDIKFCKDCRFFSTDVGIISPTLSAYLNEYQRMASAHCTHPESRIDNDGSYSKYLVTGEGIPEAPRYNYCTIMREFGCGEDAKLFEPKEPES